MAWRVIKWAAVVTWVVSLAISCVINGLPLEHAQLFFWICTGLAAFSIQAWRGWGRMVLEWLPLLALLIVYDYLRGAVSVADPQAHVGPQLAIDKAIGLGHVPTVWLQDHLYDPDHLRVWDVAIWLTYLSHFFTIWIVAALLWKLRHDRFGRYAATVVTLTLMAFLTYWLYPAQPPWLAANLNEIGPVDKIVPTVWNHLGVRTAGDLFETGDGLVNLVAAMPSLHAAYPMMLLMFFWCDGLKYRIGFGLYTLMMGFTLVYGGEHFITDVLFGWLYAGIAFGSISTLAWASGSLRASNASSTPSSPTVPVISGRGSSLPSASIIKVSRNSSGV